MGHTYADVLVHVIFSTKGRQPSIHESFRLRMYEYMCGIGRNEFGGVLSVGGTENHVHGLLRLRTGVSVAEAVRKLKSLSSGWVHRTFPDHRRFSWQAGYGAFSIASPRKARVIEYIENQVEHHRTRTFEEEFLAFLDRYGVEYDPRRIWEDDGILSG